MAKGVEKAGAPLGKRAASAAGKRSTLTFRVRGEMYKRLEASAVAAERSLSEEVESIVSQHWKRVEKEVREHSDYSHNIGQTITSAVRLAIMSTGGDPLKDAATYDAVTGAIKNVLSLLKRPEGYFSPGLAALSGAQSPAEGLERARANVVAGAAAAAAVKWARGDYSEGEADLAIMSRGQLYEPGFDRDALLKHVEETKIKPDVTKG